MNRSMACLGLLLATGCLQAATRETYPPPRAPYFHTPPNGSRWHATIEPRADVPTERGGLANATRKSQQPVRLDMLVGTNAITQGTVTYADGKEASFYLVEGRLLLTRARNTGRVIAAKANSAWYSVQSFPFPGMALLDSGNFVSVDKLDGETCYQFRIEKLKDDDVSLHTPILIWIKLKDGYPLKLDLLRDTYRFSSVTSYAGQVHLPSDFAKEYENWMREKRILEALREGR